MIDLPSQQNGHSQKSSIKDSFFARLERAKPDPTDCRRHINFWITLGVDNFSSSSDWFEKW